MAIVEPVADPGDPRLADYLSLNDAELRRQVESASGHGAGLFIGEGVTVVARLLASPYRVRSVLVTPTRLPRLLALLDEADADVTVYTADPAVVQAVAGFDLHRGVVAAADRQVPLRPADVVATAHTLVVLESLNDHENLGAIARWPAVSASTASSSTRPAPTPSTGVACGCRWARCSTSPSPG